MPEAAAPPQAAPVRATAQTTTSPASALGAGDVAGLSNEDLDDLLRGAELDDLFWIKAKIDGCIVKKLGEANRREAFRDDGATCTESWLVERFGVSTPTARALTHVATKASNMPQLLESLCAGELSFDKVRLVADVATTESDRELCDQARACSVRELADIARSAAELARTGSASSRSGSPHDARYLRFNDEHRTISAQLATESYAEAKASLAARAKEIPSDGETPWDQRCCDAFSELIRSSAAGSTGRATTASPYVVVVHVPLAALVDEDSDEQSVLAGELEYGGLIDVETVQRIACDATIVIGIDDDVGHTMYEGRARRFPTQAQRREVLRRDRHCRFPGCTNVTFTNVHHVLPWKPGGRTDLDNLALTCLHHHHLVHSNQGWVVSGNANEELTFVGPTGRVMTSRPSPRWTRVTAGPSD
jgi:hypothetical protein